MIRSAGRLAAPPVRSRSYCIAFRSRRYCLDFKKRSKSLSVVRIKMLFESAVIS